MRWDGGFRWRRLVIPCLSAGLAVALSAGPAVAAYQASVYDNKTAFTTCAGINTTIPQQLRALAVDGFRYMQYAPSSFEATTFTASKVLSRVANDQGFYVQSTEGPDSCVNRAPVALPDSSADSSRERDQCPTHVHSHANVTTSRLHTGRFRSDNGMGRSPGVRGPFPSGG